MDRRLKLDQELRDLQEEILGYQHTYFEPPESVRMKYDAVVYQRTGYDTVKANDKNYIVRDQYQVMVISRDAETALPKAILEHFSYCSPGRPTVTDNLYHFPFTIYY